MLKYVPSRAGIGEASVLAVAEPLIQAAAEQVLQRAKEIAESEGLAEYAATLRIVTGVRPKGRGYRQILADDPSGEKYEWGDDDTERRRILGQAAGVTVNVRGDTTKERKR